MFVWVVFFFDERVSVDVCVNVLSISVFVWVVVFSERVDVDVCINVLSISVSVCLCGCFFF